MKGSKDGSTQSDAFWATVHQDQKHKDLRPYIPSWKADKYFFQNRDQEVDDLALPDNPNTRSQQKVEILDQQEWLPRPQQEMVEVARLLTPHGNYGEIRMAPMCDEEDDFFTEAGPRWVQPTDREGNRTGYPRLVQLLTGRRLRYHQLRNFFVRFHGMDTVEAVTPLQYHAVLALPEALTAPQDDEHLARDLLSCTAILKDTGEEMGEVLDTQSYNVYDTLTIQLRDSFVEDLFRREDMLQRLEKWREATKGAYFQRVWMLTLTLSPGVLADLDLDKHLVVVDPPPGFASLVVLEPLAADQRLLLKRKQTMKKNYRMLQQRRQRKASKPDVWQIMAI